MPPKKAKKSELNKNPTYFKTEILGKGIFLLCYHLDQNLIAPE